MGENAYWRRFRDKAGSLTVGEAGNLRGYRPEGDYGALRPHALSIGKVRQFTGSVASDVVLLYLGGPEGDLPPSTPIPSIDVEISGGTLTAPLRVTLAYQEPNVRWAETEATDFVAALDANVGNQLRIGFFPSLT